MATNPNEQQPRETQPTPTREPGEPSQPTVPRHEDGDPNQRARENDRNRP
jgi:hypothetical protein